ncbi:MAG TPA: hypothetical protein VIA62_00655 [Thermoanaerobaculia bacterium]|jgi:hypothetical protein|nr:hypothetical protein [Thermoanaerobaculia bacterium]
MKTFWISVGTAALLFCGLAGEAFAASIVCTKASAKCYFFQSMECQDLYLNPGDACMRAKYAGFFRVRGLKIDAAALVKAQNALRQARIEFFTAKSTERGHLLLMVDDLAVPNAANALKKVGITGTVEAIPQGPLR